MGFRGGCVQFTFVFSLFCFSFAPPGFACGDQELLNDRERASLRYELKNLFNEVDLLIRNQKTDRSDLQKQENDFKILKVYQRIPLQFDWEGLKRDLVQSGGDFGLKVHSFQHSLPPVISEPIPKQITSGRPFRLKESQLVDTLRFWVEVSGGNPELLTGRPELGNTRDRITAWTESWHQQQLRLAERWNDSSWLQAHPKNPDRWRIEGKAYRYREIQFPNLVPRSPRNLLPGRVLKNLDRFSKQEPYLWNLVVKTEELIPKTKPLYELRSQFLLNDARLTFYLNHAVRSAN